jgi:hypothetical protein
MCAFAAQAASIYILWILLHFVAVYLYHKFCALTTFMGLLMSPFLVVAPHCKALRWVIQMGGNTMETMWIVLGFWLIKKLVMPKADS